MFITGCIPTPATRWCRAMRSAAWWRKSGAGVTGFAPGDKVVFMPQVTCGECYPCRHGMYHICDNLKVMGFQTSGAAQEYFPVKAEMVLKLPETMTAGPSRHDRAGFGGCACPFAGRQRARAECGRAGRRDDWQPGRAGGAGASGRKG